jgi:flavin reductase (NADH)
MMEIEFRNAMSLLSAAVNVITTDGPCGRAAITASAVCSVTDTPPTVLVCINKRSSIHDKLLENKKIGINILSGEHEDIARTFAGQTGVEHDKRFDVGQWLQGESGVPVLHDAAGNLEGKIIDARDSGSHTVFFIGLEHIKYKENQSSLTYFSRRFHALK